MDEDDDITNQDEFLQPDNSADNTGAFFEEELEDECRICRGPAEEGRPLLKPCKCSGSMGMTHQDCLISWLELKRGDGRCEICKTKFRFDPQYAENAPDRLAAHEVILGLSSRFIARWLPLALRILFATFLWLVVAPYLTNCLYLGWIIKPSSILTRRDTILSDVVSGAVMGATIIISFLSLMSFADFLRVLWQRPPEQQVEVEQNDEGLGGDENHKNNNEVDIDINDIDERIVEVVRKYHQKEMMTSFYDTTEQLTGKSSEFAQCDESKKQDDDGAETKNLAKQIGTNQGAEKLREQATKLRNLTIERQSRQNNANIDSEQTRVDNNGIKVGESRKEGDDACEDLTTLRIDEGPNDNTNEEGDVITDDVDDSGYNDNDGESVDVEIVDDDQGELEDVDDVWMGVLDDDDNNDDHIDDENNVQQPQGVAFDPLDPAQDDQVDMEINVALDELLGLRGPLSTLVRNLLWLLAFNATYLGIFGFVPKAVGSVIYSSIFNTTLCDNVLNSIPYVSSIDKNRTTIISMLTRMEEESIRGKTSFKLSDFATVTLGYLSIASFIVMLRYGLLIIKKGGKIFGRNSVIESQNRDEAANLRRGHGEDVNDAEAEDIFGGAGIGDSIGTAMDATVAIIKVCVLLFMKMFLLPLSLGIWLDASTAKLFGHDIASSLAFAGRDLFSFLLLHWVAGITFMLLVTVFLLQLREVTHPDILAKLIRPQEPQPDLLGNLMHEKTLTHMKRMLLSLAIYAPLLTLHVTVPIMLFHASYLENRLKFFHLNFYHLLTPQLQIPLELITFHLSMLALLERHKNTIGGLQHRWMKFMCLTLGLTKYILPRRVKEFEFIGTKPVFLKCDEDKTAEIDPLFTSLVKKEDVDQLISNNIDKSRYLSQSTTVVGEQRPNGERVLSIGIRSISLPVKASLENNLFLPTKIGKYRLRVEDSKNGNPFDMKIAFFQEVQGEEIERPPEGWDDLGQGGAFVQGRWAWAEERKSFVEQSVAERTPFRASSKVLIIKVMILILLSWVAIIVVGFAVLSLPLLVGRSFYYLLRIPDSYIHDPLAFCVGAGLFFPTLSLVIRSINAAEERLLQRGIQWMARIRRPPTGKIIIVLETLLHWILVAPLALGLSYDFVFVKSPKWFSRDEMYRVDCKTLALSWLMGLVVLNTWSYLLCFKFFTRRFWTNIGNGILEPPFNQDGNANANPNANANANARNREEINTENGLNFRAAKFFKILKSVLLDWEWDAVDRTILIDDFALPATREICSALVGSLLSYRVVLYVVTTLFSSQQGDVTIPLHGFVEDGVFRKFIFRFCMMIHLLFQIGSRSRAKINSWFEFAHEAARDDRYLIGEILMNYADH